MSKYISMFIAVMSCMTISFSSCAGTSEVIWTEPEKYRDINSGNEPKTKYRERIFKEFEMHFAKMANELPEGHTLNINVTDVDLAGDVNAGGIDRIRIVRDLYFPRLKFSYDLYDSHGEKIKAGGTNLKDMGFLVGSNLHYRNKPLSYEKHMLDKWFNSTFGTLLAN